MALQGLKRMVQSGSVDFGRQSETYEKYRPGFPKSFYNKIKQRIVIKDARVLDIGTGTGHVAFGMVEAGASKAVGVDISENQVMAARKSNKNKNLACTFAQGTAEETKQDSDSFDIVTAGQCWHWFDGDKALQEINRVLKPDGYLVIAHNDYLTQRSKVAKKSEELVLKYNSKWKLSQHDGTYPSEIRDILRGGFEFTEQFCYDETVNFTRESWQGRMLTCNGIGSSDLKEDDIKLWSVDMDKMLFSFEEPIQVWHRIWVTIGKKPS
mmetsp:Transcript_25383/g.28235  ORF Transcript_25383/g.28235 Transcript_25383/m.28235 type:complete len:267 (-) Transcript_25383:85-885(-)